MALTKFHVQKIWFNLGDNRFNVMISSEIFQRAISKKYHKYQDSWVFFKSILVVYLENPLWWGPPQMGPRRDSDYWQSFIASLLLCRWIPFQRVWSCLEWWLNFRGFSTQSLPCLSPGNLSGIAGAKIVSFKHKKLKYQGWIFKKKLCCTCYFWEIARR